MVFWHSDLANPIEINSALWGPTTTRSVLSVAANPIQKGGLVPEIRVRNHGPLPRDFHELIRTILMAPMGLWKQLQGGFPAR